MKVISCCLAVLVTFFAISGVSQAGEEFVFPVGIWVTEDLRKPGWPFDIPAEDLVDLRSKGVKMILLNGRYSGKKWYQIQGNIWFDSVMADVDTLKKKLARADSFGFLVYAVPKSIDETLKYWGHDDSTNPSEPYFRYYNSQRFTAATFQDTLDSLVSWVVDSLNAYLQANDIQSLYRYIFWDEPWHHHVFWRGTPGDWDDYWDNIWEHDDSTGRLTDNRGVGTLLKYKIEEKDTLHSVWFNLAAPRRYVSDTMNSYRGFCSLYVDTLPNPPHELSLNARPFGYQSPIGDTTTLRVNYTDVIDSVLVAARTVDSASPPPVYATQSQSFGACNVDGTKNLRITIPEEVKELANLAVLHGLKGFMHYVLWSGSESGDSFGCLWDDDMVPYNALYEEYVYNRMHGHFSHPETLRPFNPDEDIHDPFRTLPPEPVDTVNYHRYLEDYYQWKYAPYARIYNALGEVNNHLHIVGTELLDLWKAPSVAIIEADSSNIFLPEIVTFSPTQTSDVYLFFVNKDMKHSQMGFTVRIMRSSVPESLQSSYILDLSERHLIQRTIDFWYVTFHVTLGAGEGKLIRLMQGTETADPMVTDPDIEFQLLSGGAIVTPQDIFTEGDSVRLSATIFNLGFSSLNSVPVKFYDGHKDPLNFIRADTVSLPALNPLSTDPADTVASIIWPTSHDNISPHNITVFVEEPISPHTNTGNNEANMALLVLPEDYATAVVGDAWDMTEREMPVPGQPATADIDSFEDFIETPDSISGVWEAKTSPGTPKVYLHLTGPIDGSKYNQLSLRFIHWAATTGGGYLKIGWENTDATFGSDSTYYVYDEWNISMFGLSENSGWKNKQIATLWVRPSPLPMPNRLVRLAWARLTTEP